MDTIKLQIPINNSFDSLLRKKYFRETKYTSDGRSVQTNVRWIKEMRKKGAYVPTYGVHENYNDPGKRYLVIEFSAPKLLFGENVTELKDCNFIKIVIKLQSFIKGLGLYVFEKQILNAKVEKIAIGKNMPLGTICSVDTVINILSRFDYKPHADHRMINFYDHKSGGKEIYFNIKESETTKIYDKKRELLNNAKTTEEKKLAIELNKDKYCIEMLRVEITYKTSRKVKSKFSKHIQPFIKDTFR